MAKKSVPQEQLVGSENGMTMLTYLGGNFGTEDWQVPGSRFRYKTSAAQRNFLVDSGEVYWFMAQTEHGVHLFEVAEAQPEPQETETPKRQTNVQRHGQYTPEAQNRASEYAIDITKLTGSGVDGVVTLDDVNAEIEGLVVDATAGAIDAAQKAGVDLKVLVNRVDGRIGKKDVDDYIASEAAKDEQDLADGQAILQEIEDAPEEVVDEEEVE